MGVRFTLTTDLTENEVMGKHAFLILGTKADRKTVIDAAVTLKAGAMQQRDELTYHRKKMETEGVGDRDVAASLEALLEAAERAETSADTDLIRERGATRTAVAAGRAEAKVADALARGFITPAMRDWATALCNRDEASFDAFLTNAVPAWGHLATQVLPNTPPQSDRQAEASPTAAAICAQLGLAPGTLKE